MPAKEFMTVREAAERLGVHENTVRNWETAGTLRGFKLPGSGFRRFHREDIERMRAEMLGAPVPTEEIPETTRRGVSGETVDGEIL